MLSRSSFRLLIIGAFFTATSVSIAQTVTITINSDAGDWIGQGQHLTNNYAPSASQTNNFYVNNYFYMASGSPSYLEFILGDSTATPNNFALFTISNRMLNHDLQVGTYLNAERAAFASAGHPGLDFSFQNRGSNTLTGQFTINSVHYVNVAGTNVVKDLDVNFEQHSEGATAACFGHVVYNSGLVPEPMTFLTIGFGLVGLLRRKRK